MTTNDGRRWTVSAPRDPQGEKLSASHLYNGTRSQFEKAGFAFVRSKGEFNCVMRITFGPV